MTKHLTGRDMDNAAVVASILVNLDTDLRGDFMKAVGMELRRAGQGYTGSLFEAIAKLYNHDEP